MANSIDYMNYIISQAYEQTFIYKKTISDVIITGGSFYIASQHVLISEIDTSLLVTDQKLFVNAINYIYIKDGAYYITTTQDDSLFLI